MKRNRRDKRKPWINYDDVVHYKDGGWIGKARCSDEQAKEFLSKQSMFGLFKDDKGYYHKTGELICTAD